MMHEEQRLDVYHDMFQAHLAETRQSHAGDDSQYRSVLPSSVIAPSTTWSAEEKNAFLHALSVYSRLRPDLIASSIRSSIPSSTKTSADVWAYISVLQHASEEKGRPDGWRQSLPSARVLTPRWRRFEEGCADVLLRGEASARVEAVRQRRREELRQAGLDTALGLDDTSLAKLCEPGDALRRSLGKRKRDDNDEKPSRSPSPSSVPLDSLGENEELRVLQAKWLQEDFLFSIDDIRALSIRRVLIGNDKSTLAGSTPRSDLILPFSELVRAAGFHAEDDGKTKKEEDGEGEVEAEGKGERRVDELELFNLHALIKTTEVLRLLFDPTRTASSSYTPSTTAFLSTEYDSLHVGTGPSGTLQSGVERQVLNLMMQLIRAFLERVLARTERLLEGWQRDRGESTRILPAEQTLALHKALALESPSPATPNRPTLPPAQFRAEFATRLKIGMQQGELIQDSSADEDDTSSSKHKRKKGRGRPQKSDSPDDGKVDSQGERKSKKRRRNAPLEGKWMYPIYAPRVDGGASPYSPAADAADHRSASASSPLPQADGDGDDGSDRDSSSSQRGRKKGGPPRTAPRNAQGRGIYGLSSHTPVVQLDFDQAVVTDPPNDETDALWMLPVDLRDDSDGVGDGDEGRSRARVLISQPEPEGSDDDASTSDSDDESESEDDDLILQADREEDEAYESALWEQFGMEYESDGHPEDAESDDDDGARLAKYAGMDVDVQSRRSVFAGIAPPLEIGDDDDEGEYVPSD